MISHTIRLALRATAGALLALAFVATFATNAVAVNIATVPVGNPGNADDPTSDGPFGTFGGVSYNYRIGTYEVTNDQYVEFLNAKAASDPLELYDPFMTSNAHGGIVRSGGSGSYTYSAKANMGNKPVNWVSWYDTIRFANWINNGQGDGDTETGAYTLEGGTPTPSNGGSIARNANATWFLPSGSEWFKAAYYQPASQGGDSDNYWLYPTASNVAPTVATLDAQGNITNPGDNVANYNAGYTIDPNSTPALVPYGNLSTVGSAGPLSESFYGTSDQGGNINEWCDGFTVGAQRGVRGGPWFSPDWALINDMDAITPDFSQISVGFRLATVPEPSTGILAALACSSLLCWRKRRK